MVVAVEGPTLHVARTQPAQLFPILVYAIPKDFVHSWARLSGIEHSMVPMKRKDAGSLIGALTFFYN